MTPQRLLEFFIPIKTEEIVEGVQQVDGQWYMPLYGSDTMQHIIDEMREERPEAERNDC